MLRGMGMYFDLSISDITNIRDVEAFFNSPAKDFYFGNMTFKDGHFIQNFKSIILSTLNEIERTNRGTFGCDLFLKTGRAEMLKEMYPTICDIFNINEDKDVIRLGRFLESFRNSNAHSKLGEDDKKFYNSCSVNFKNHKYLNERIRLVTNNNLMTMGGLCFVFLCMLRQESLSNLIKKTYLFVPILLEKGEFENRGSHFVSKVSKVNLECHIRKKKGNTVIDSIIGDAEKYSTHSEDRFQIRIGGINNATFEVNGEYKNGILKIQSGSLTKIYYENDYVLEIENEDTFIEESNSLPTMAFVDYLCKKGIKKYSGKENYSKDASKLNCPKYYIDKNIDILLLPNTVSDYRILSSILGNNLTRVCLMIEDYIYTHYHVDNKNGFSSIGNALLSLNVPWELIYEIKFIRNFACHGYLMNEIIVYKDAKRVFSLDYVIDTLGKALKYFKDSNHDVYELLTTLVDKVFVKTIILMKYKLLIRITKDILMTYPDFNIDDLRVKNCFINNSYFDNEIFRPICSVNHMVKVVRIKNLHEYLAIFGSDYHYEQFLEAIKQKGLTVEREEGLENIVSTVYIQ